MQGLIQTVADLAHPSLSLVSNGAECIVLDKKFFLEHAPAKQLELIREKVSLHKAFYLDPFSGPVFFQT